ncbi:hypothetical protein Nepgr_026476 [Nepenthes gracilis]|uniref:Glycosyltransferase n=1 Tax=Nepenthes gracilis TaxID=150966 RepID=A0AAD3T731_NEPGR|nr:hypothetical protein Nepgr_026476 [Nepenthes gracilis]
MAIPSKPHVALLSSPGLGHLIPVIELAKRLVTHHSCKATVFVVTGKPCPVENQLLQSAAASNLFDIAVLPHVNATFPPETEVLTRLLLMIQEALPALHSSIASMTHRPTALIVDLFGTEAIKLAREFGIKNYVFIASNAWFLAFAAYFPHMGKVEKNEPVKLPGCNPIPYRIIEETFPNPDSRVYHEFSRVAVEISTADGILVNTWEDLEGRTLGSLKAEEFLKPKIKSPVYAIGPLVRQARPAGSKSALIEWLNKQPNRSVIYVSFGSGGTLTAQQTMEMAWGLELSQQRFIWVIRPPIDYDATASLESEDDKNDGDAMSKYFPAGFLTRTRDIGMVTSHWAPQVEILGHLAIGGFLSHCGWNSTLESLVNGIPIITWPLYAEQDMNATMLVCDFEVATGRTAKPSGVAVGRNEIERMVRKVMVENDGDAIRSRAKELQRSGERALEVGGSSYEALSRVVEECDMSLI